MDGLVEFAQPQQVAAVLVLVLLSLVLVIETVMVALAFRRPEPVQSGSPLVEEWLSQEAYDWLYE